MATAGATAGPVSLSVRAGKTLTFDVNVLDNTPQKREMDLTTYTGTLQIRDARGRRRVLLTSTETPVEDSTTAALQRLSKGKWRIFLGKSYTSWLPMISRFEVDLQNSVVADDVLNLVSGTITVRPEGVSRP